MRTALITIAMTQVDSCARPSNAAICLNADSIASCTASSASSGLRSHRIATRRKCGRRCCTIFSNSIRSSGIACLAAPGSPAAELDAKPADPSVNACVAIIPKSPVTSRVICLGSNLIAHGAHSILRTNGKSIRRSLCQLGDGAAARNGLARDGSANARGEPVSTLYCQRSTAGE